MDYSASPSRLSRFITPLLLALSPIVAGYDLDPHSPSSVKSTAKDMAEDMLSFYSGNKPGGEPGILPAPYYWWEGGAMMGALVEYWYYTKDHTFVNLTQSALLAQVGENNDYMPRAQNLNEGNDDQGFWAMAVMAATEYNFPNPPADQPQWLALSQAVFNTQAARWDNKHCGGGLRWQIFNWNNGYDYKNSISQACFFALGARLALYTGNATYAKWATKTWDWMTSVKFISDDYYVYDGSDIESNCTKITPYQFSYNAGGFLVGAAAMYNYTEDKVWKDRVDGLVKGAKVFFPTDDIMMEVACEGVDLCDLDQQSFKAYLSRWLAATVQWAPHTYDDVIPLLQASAVAAGKQCVGGNNKRMCGLKWNTGKYDGTTGIGQQMAAMEVTLSCMIRDRPKPVTAHSGGTSKGNPGGGGDDVGRTSPTPKQFAPLNAGDRVGAAILTILLIASMIAGIGWLMIDETSARSPMEQMRGFPSSATMAIAAFAVGGGKGVAKVQKRNPQGLKEKGRATVTSVSGSSSRSSGENNKQASAMVVGQVRSESSSQQRRLSNMPLGWPHNPSLRGSALLEPEPRRPQSLENRPVDSASHSDNEASGSGSGH